MRSATTILVGTVLVLGCGGPGGSSGGGWWPAQDVQGSDPGGSVDPGGATDPGGGVDIPVVADVPTTDPWVPQPDIPSCVPDCTNKVCGDNGCGQPCGTCEGETHCEAGQCVPDCAKQCAGKECGSDGCGGVCGQCEPGDTCTPEGTCEPPATCATNPTCQCAVEECWGGTGPPGGPELFCGGLTQNCTSAILNAYTTLGCDWGGCDGELPFASGICGAACADFVTMAEQGGQEICEPCGGTGGCVQDTEPNNTDTEVQSFTPGPEGFCIEGSVTCGNDGSAYTGDYDLFAFIAPASGSATFTLTWSTSSDLDFVLNDEAENVLHDFEDGAATSENGSGTMTAGTGYALRIACWDGTDQTYTFTMSW